MIVRSLFVAFTYLCMVAAVVMAVKIDVISSPGNIVRELKVCNHQLPEDAVADFLARQGIHDESFVPIQSEYSYLLERICDQASRETTTNERMKRSCGGVNRTENPHVYPTPSLFINPESTFVTLYFYDKSHLLEPGQSEPFGIPVYLRRGYTHTDNAQCACSMVGCSMTLWRSTCGI